MGAISVHVKEPGIILRLDLSPVSWTIIEITKCRLNTQTGMIH